MNALPADELRGVAEPHRAVTAQRAVLLLAAVPPILFGAAAAFSPADAARWTEFFSRSSVVLTPELEYLSRPLGLFVLAFGALLAFAAGDPLRYRVVVAWGGVVFLLRGLQRLALTSDLERLFDVPPWLNVAHAGYLIALSAALLGVWAKTSPSRSSIPEHSLDGNRV